MTERLHTLTVHTDPAYPVVIGAGLLTRCGELLREIVLPCRMAVVTDSNVAPLYLEQVAKSLRAAGYTVSTHLFPAGEPSKNPHTLASLWESLAEAGLTRGDCIAALGGGVVGDLAGFAAATYLRGIRYVQLPTTMLAAVDSSVGGKTAIDLQAGKNLAGAFLQPAAVLCDTDCLDTLPPSILSDGIAEAVKTGVLTGGWLFDRLLHGLPGRDFAAVIAQCVQYKAGVVERDEKEQGERRLLNLGHTVGHAIERCSGYTVPHGHGVAVGLAVMTRASARLGWTDETTAACILDCLSRQGLPVTTDCSPEALTEAALHDKKRSGDRITLVIPERIGGCVCREVPVTLLPEIITKGLVD